MKLFLAVILILGGEVFAQSYPKGPEGWWQECLGERVSWEVFEAWLGDDEAPSRVWMRKHLKEKAYQSMLEVACGLGIDYWGLKKEGFTIDYIGMDVTPKLVEYGKRMGIPVVQGNVENIPFEDGVVDFVYARHLLEHLQHYETAMKEMVRVASKEVCVIFFIPPQASDRDSIVPSIPNGHLLYHNAYSLPKMEAFLRSQPKVLAVQWEKINEKEVMLHVYIKS